VVTRAAEALEALEHLPSLELLQQTTHQPEALLRLLARREPQAPTLLDAAKRGEQVALNHLQDLELLQSLLKGPHRVQAAWGLSRLRAVPEVLAQDPDPQVRAAAARGLFPENPALALLCQDPDPGVAWMAQRAVQGAFGAEVLERRLGAHPRSHLPSAQPPYGLRPQDQRPELKRAEAALALCHNRFDINLGVAVRSAEAAGLREVFLLGRGDLFRSPARGTDQVLNIQHVKDPEALLQRARARGYQLVAVQQTPDSLSYLEAVYPPRPLFILGAEDTGIPSRLRHAADLVVEIPMFGLIDSLNVAAAATTVMMYWSGRRAMQEER